MASPRAILITKGTRGDLVPFLAIGGVLRDAGWEVTLFSHATYAGLAFAAGFEFAACDTLLEAQAFMADTDLLESSAGVETFVRRHVLPRTPQEIAALVALCRKGRTLFVEHHMSGFAAQCVAELNDVPVVTVYIAASQVHTRCMLDELCMLRFADEINGARVRVGLAACGKRAAVRARSDLDVVGWPEWFANVGGKLPRVHYAGFLTDGVTEMGELPVAVAELLAEDPRPVLITGGTARWSLAARFYRAAAEGCAAAGRKAILVTPFPDLPPTPLPAGIAHFERLPLGSVAPRVSLMIHHGGLGATARALHAGVPQLCMPFGADRPDMARRLRDAGVARTLRPPEWTEREVADAITALQFDGKLRGVCGAQAARVRSDTGLAQLPHMLTALLPQA